MSSLGIYFGPTQITIVEAKGRKFANIIQVPQSAVSGGELDEKVPVAVKTNELIAVLRDELRRGGITAKEAVLVLSGKDLIVRTFEMPALPREELQSAVNFEAKKYIPFKVEDLVSDFQVQIDKVNRINQVLFVGIKRETLDRYIGMLGELGIKINSVEYSGFSLVRPLKLSGISDKGLIAVIGTDTKGEDEVNFTVLDNGYPLFSRDIALTAGAAAAEGFEASAGAGPEAGMAIEKLKSEIRVSLDYFHRKFPAKRIEKAVFFSDQINTSDLEPFMRDIGLGVAFVDVNKVLGRPVPYSLSLIKSFSASLFDAVKLNLKIDILAAKDKAAIVKQGAAAIGGAIGAGSPADLLKGLKIDFKILGLSVLICAATFGYGIYQMQPIKQDIKNTIALRVPVATVNPDTTYEELAAKDTEYKNKLNALDKIVKNQLYMTKPLDLIPKAMPKGVWLTRFAFNNNDTSKPELALEGMAYLADNNKEVTTVNEFLANLKNNSDFAKYFKYISVVSLDSKKYEDVTATNFVISCKN